MNAGEGGERVPAGDCCEPLRRKGPRFTRHLGYAQGARSPEATCAQFSTEKV